MRAAFKNNFVNLRYGTRNKTSQAACLYVQQGAERHDDSGSREPVSDGVYAVDASSGIVRIGSFGFLYRVCAVALGKKASGHYSKQTDVGCKQISPILLPDCICDERAWQLVVYIPLVMAVVLTGVSLIDNRDEEFSIE